jgi:hypothetical protein
MPPSVELRSARRAPDLVCIPAWKTGAVIDIFANAALRWLCRPGARIGVPLIQT